MTTGGHRLLAGLVVALVLLGATWTWAGPAHAQQATIKIREAVLDEDGTVRLTIQPVGTDVEALEASDLQVEESGTPVTDFTLTPLGETQVREVATALVIDTSGSMVGEPLAATKAAASSFVRQLAEDRVSILLLSFSDAPSVLTRGGADAQPAVDAIQSLEADGETALYDAVVLAAQELQRLEAQPNLVVFSDGGDTVSQATLEDAIAAADAADVPVTAVALTTEESDTGALQRLAGASGGTVLATGDVSGLEGAFDTVATEITTQYVIEYRADRADLRELDIAVAWTGPDGAASDAVTVLNPRTAPPDPLDFYVKPDAGLLASLVALVLGLAGTFGAAFLVLTLLFVRPGGEATRLLNQELAAYVRDERGTKRVRSSSSVAHALRERAEALMMSTPRPEGFDERVQQRLDQAAWPLRTSEFLAIQLGSGLALAALTLVVAPWWFAVLMFAAGAALPWVALDVQRNRRRRAFLSRFPDTLQLLAGSLRAGYGIMQAMDAVGRESGPPTSEEFSRALTEARLGAPLEDALDGMADRLGSDDVRWVVLAIKIQREVGGNLAELLTTVARTLREREALRRQIAVLSAEGKLSAVILIVLPFLLGLYLSLVNPEYVRVLVQTTVGWIMIAGGAVLMGLGVVWIRRMIRIEV